MKKIKEEKPNININLDLSLSNLGYEPSSTPITNDDIFYYWGYKDLYGFRQKPQVIKAGTKTLKPEDPQFREKVIAYAKEKMRPRLPDELEFIPREYWMPFEDFMGEDLRLLHHPIWWFTQRIIRENFKPCSDTLIIQACSNMKPYLDNRNYANTRPLFEQGCCDLVVNSCELVPIEFTIFYPFRHYDWSHLKETEFISDCLERNNFHSIVSFINNFKYKKVLLFGPTYFSNSSYYSYEQLYNDLLDNYKGTDVTILNVMDKDTSEEVIASLGGQGFAKSRYQVAKCVKSRIMELIDYKGPVRDYYNFGMSIKNWDFSNNGIIGAKPPICFDKVSLEKTDLW